MQPAPEKPAPAEPGETSEPDETPTPAAFDGPDVPPPQGPPPKNG